MSTMIEARQQRIVETRSVENSWCIRLYVGTQVMLLHEEYQGTPISGRYTNTANREYLEGNYHQAGRE